MLLLKNGMEDIHISYITVTFYDYNNNQRIAVVKSSGIGMTISHDQNNSVRCNKENMWQVI